MQLSVLVSPTAGDHIRVTLNDERTSLYGTWTHVHPATGQIDLGSGVTLFVQDVDTIDRLVKVLTDVRAFLVERQAEEEAA